MKVYSIFILAPKQSALDHVDVEIYRTGGIHLAVVFSIALLLYQQN